MEHTDANNNNKILMITSKDSTSGNIRCSSLGIDTFFTVNANEITLIAMPNTVEVLGSEIIEEKALHISSEKPIAVYAHQYQSQRSEATLILPEEALDKGYYVMSYNADGSESAPSEFLAVAVEDSTSIKISLTNTTMSGRLKGTEFSILLDSGQVYQVQSAISSTNFVTPDDLTGTKVSGNKPFALFAGSAKSRVPANPGNCFAQDNLFEQMYPIESWGKRFVYVPIKLKAYDVIRIIASEDNTQININGNIVSNLNAGTFYEDTISKPSFIFSNKSIMVAQYITGNSCSGNIGDPAMVLLSPIEQTIDSITFFNSSFQNIDSSFVNIIIRTADTSFIRLDSMKIGDRFSVLPAEPTYAYLQQSVSQGVHNLSVDSGCGFNAVVYGLGHNLESYAYSAGSNFNKINVNIDIANFNEFALPNSGCLEDTFYFSIETSANVSEYYWDFGDGVFDSVSSPTHVYSDTGQFLVNAYVITVGNCDADTAKAFKYIDVGDIDSVQFLFGDTCLKDSSRLIDISSVQNDSVVSWNWDWGDGFIDTIQNPTHLYSDSGGYNVRLTIQTQYGCVDSSVDNFLKIFPLPKANLFDDSICLGESVMIQNNAPHNYAYVWTPSSSLGDTLSAEPIAFPDSTTTYHLLVSNQYNCVKRDSATIIVLERPISQLIEDTIIFLDECVLLSGKTDNYNYIWRPITGLDDESSGSPLACPRQTTLYYVTIDDGSCTINDSVLIIVISEHTVDFPNAFVPEGRNSNFYPIALGINKWQRFIIRNRWGDIIYDDISANWDGKYKHEEQPMGMYFYYFEAITFDDQKISGSGSFALIR